MDSVFPDWKHAPQNQAIRRWDGPPDPRAWPADPIEQLVWLVTSGAEAWVPTLKQLDALKEQCLRDRAHPDGETQPRPVRQVLNEPPRNHYDRIATVIGASNRERMDV